MLRYIVWYFHFSKSLNIMQYISNASRFRKNTFQMFKSLLLLYIFIILANAILVIYSSVEHKILRSVWRGCNRFPRKEMIAPKADDLLSQVLQHPVIVLSLNIHFVVNLVVYCSLNRFRIL